MKFPVVASALLFGFVLTGCGKVGRPIKLASGAELRVTYDGNVSGTSFVEYCTELPLGDRPALSAEADLLWRQLSVESVHAQTTEAQVWPTTCHWQLRWSGWTPALINRESTDIAYSRVVGGAWVRKP